jgi:cysteine-S-conjugate beta-lyase
MTSQVPVVHRPASVSGSVLDPRFDAVNPSALLEVLSSKWRLFDADVLPVWVADMDFPIADPILQALESYVHKGFFGYPPRTIYADLAKGFCSWSERRYGFAVDTDLVGAITEVVQGMHALVHVFTEPGDAVLLVVVWWSIECQ